MITHQSNLTILRELIFANFGKISSAKYREINLVLKFLKNAVFCLFLTPRVGKGRFFRRIQKVQRITNFFKFFVRYFLFFSTNDRS